MNWLQGKKTYIIGILTIALGVVRLLTGDNRDGLDLIIGGLGMMTLRAGVSKVQT